MISLSDSEAARWIKAVQPVIADYKKNMVAKGYKESDIDGWVTYIKERIEYWHKEQKTRGILSAF
jgi:hypothetical protein